jgi:hypothetical protein
MARLFWDVAAGVAGVVSLALASAMALTVFVGVRALALHLWRRIPAWPEQSRARP